MAGLKAVDSNDELYTRRATRGIVVDIFGVVKYWNGVGVRDHLGIQLRATRALSCDLPLCYDIPRSVILD